MFVLRRNDILNEIRAQCVQEYSMIEDWVHGIEHINAVVLNGKTLAKMERLRSKDAFLLEIACWLHDIGRIGEGVGLSAKQSNHAEVSYWKSKKLLKRYERPLGRESVFKVLQAVREHSLPVLRHPDNQINRLLLDSDRGANLNVCGIFRMLNYMQLIETGPVYTVDHARELLDRVFQELSVSKKKRLEALDYLDVLRDWYYGNGKQKVSGVRVTALYSDSARELYKEGIEEIEAFITRLRSV